MMIENKVINHIKRYGPVSYEEFMQLCLYEFKDSYYRKEDPVGFHGDFITSPFLHPVFGSLIAIKLFSMWDSLERPGVFDVVELGAGNGKLSIDILDYSKHISRDFYDAIRYFCVDVREFSFNNSYEHMSKIEGINIDRLFDFSIRGCILSNEFFDALPVSRICREGNELLEVKVAWSATGLYEVYVPVGQKILKQIKHWGIEIPEGYTVEVGTVFESIIEGIASILHKGFVLTIDYGGLSEDLYGVPSRKHGTIRSFKNNVQVNNVLGVPGTQDITSHVNFSMLMEKGVEVGLKLEEFTLQRTFMMNLGCDWMLDKLDKLGQNSLERSIYVLNKRRIENLLDESGLGGFRVMVQSKDVLTNKGLLIEDFLNCLKVPILNKVV